jgi:hypothetical protein
MKRIVARIDRVAVLDAVRPDDRAAVFPFVVRRRRVERAAHEQAHGRLRLRAGRRVIEEILVAGANDIGRPAIVAASRDHVRAGLSARHGLHDRAASAPRPAIVGRKRRQAVAGGIDIEFAVGFDDGRGIVHAGLAVERQPRREGEQHRGGGESESRHRVAGSTDSVRLKNGITCS